MPGFLWKFLTRRLAFHPPFAYAESSTSENASRLLTMQSAEKNIEERLAELNTLYHGQRQGAITSELLDIVSSVEALSGDSRL
jgi:F-type H+-transporting ATPase subunit gamma